MCSHEQIVEADPLLNNAEVEWFMKRIEEVRAEIGLPQPREPSRLRLRGRLDHAEPQDRPFCIS